jgi:hypothetical protein
MSLFKKNTKNKEIPPERNMIPRGISHSIVPEEYLNKIYKWDGHLFNNQIIIKAKK